MDDGLGHKSNTWIQRTCMLLLKHLSISILFLLIRKRKLSESLFNKYYPCTFNCQSVSVKIIYFYVGNRIRFFNVSCLVEHVSLKPPKNKYHLKPTIQDVREVNRSNRKSRENPLRFAKNKCLSWITIQVNDWYKLWLVSDVRSANMLHFINI